MLCLVSSVTPADFNTFHLGQGAPKSIDAMVHLGDVGDEMSSRLGNTLALTFEGGKSGKKCGELQGSMHCFIDLQQKTCTVGCTQVPNLITQPKVNMTIM